MSTVGGKAQKVASNVVSSLCGKKTITIDNFDKIQAAVNGTHDMLAANLIKKVQKQNPDFIQIIDGGKKAIIKESNVLKDLFDSLIYPVCKLPKDLLDVSLRGLEKVFPKSKTLAQLNVSGFITKHRNFQLHQKEMHALRGLFTQMQELSKGIPLTNRDGAKTLAENMAKMLNESFSAGAAKYNTRDERALTRLVTSLIPAFFLGNDAYNMAKKNGATDKEANDSSKRKFNQEMFATVSESYSQFAMLGGFQKFINTKLWGAPLINTISSIGSGAVSRKAVGRELLPVKIDETNNVIFKGKALPLTMQDYIAFLGSDNKDNKDNSPISPAASALDSDGTNKKKGHIISFKNIAIFCATSIAVGFSLKHFGPKVLEKIKQTPLFNEIKDSKFVKNALRWYKEQTQEMIFASKDELGKFYETLTSATKKNADVSEYSRLAKDYLNKTNNAFNDGNPERILIGIVDKTFKIPLINQEVPVKELFKIPLNILKIPFEFLSYPYKAVQKIVDGIGALGAKNVVKAANLPTIDPRDPFNMANIYKDFLRQSDKFKDKGAEAFQTFYGEHFYKHLLNSVDNESISKIDNKKIGKLTQLFTMVASTYFAVTDDYNQTAKQTNDAEKAHKSGRERFIQKMTRVFVQIGLMDIFNNLFRLQYNNSLPGAIAVGAMNTLVTDAATRKLLGKPIGKKSTEELETHDKKRENSAWFKFTNWLAS